ncbi:hypothetical protein K8I61_00915 [bacterium]|nr:hypothetical protein [bacterium]
MSAAPLAAQEESSVIDRFAVVMNVKARRVKEATIRLVSSHVPPDDLFITRTIEQSDDCLREIVRRRYPLVFCGGGDGTAMRIIEQLSKHVRALGDATARLPRIGILKLGTGNAWAGLVKSPPGAQPIERVKRGAALKFTPYYMAESNGRLSHMGGVGIDALVLNDYFVIKSRFPSGIMWRLVNSVFGYLIAMFGRTIPGLRKTGGSVNVRVYNESDEPVYGIAHDQEPWELPFKKGDLIHEGPLKWIGWGTTENFGYNMRVFPFATAKPGYMNLRLLDTPVGRLVRNIPRVWRGSFRDARLQDLLVTKFRLESDVDLPLQLGGDPEGFVRSISLSVVEPPVEVLDFR